MNKLMLLSGLAVACGALIVVQAATNTVLAKHSSHIVWTAVTLFSIGLVFLLALAIGIDAPLPSFKAMSEAPVWSYVGGMIVASYVCVITFLVPKLGAAQAILLIVIGQAFASLLIEHYGWFGLEVRSLSFTKVVGCVLLVLGFLLTKR